MEESPADLVGIEMGDKILTINDQNFLDSDAVYEEVVENIDSEIIILVDRRGEQIEFKVTPAQLEGYDHQLLGISMLDTGVIKYNIFESIWRGLSTTGILIWRVLEAFGLIIASLFTGGELANEVSGPVGVAVITGQVVKMGWLQVLQFAAILSINLGIINILPFPALDGGRLLFILAEAATRKKLSEKIENIIHNSGFILLLVLLVFVTFRDISKYSSNILDFFKNLI